MQDAIIIGCGPAGLSAALYILRAGFSVTIIGKDNGALTKAEKIENYFGLPAPLDGNTLVENGKEQARALGVSERTLYRRLRDWEKNAAAKGPAQG